AELAHPHPLHRLAGACPLVAGGMPARRSPYLGMHRGDGAHSLLAAPPRPMMGPLPATVSGRCRCELRAIAGNLGVIARIRGKQCEGGAEPPLAPPCHRFRRDRDLRLDETPQDRYRARLPV